MIDSYPRLKQLMMTYINMDAEEITGEDTLEGMLRYYTTRVSGKAIRELLAEVSAFRQAYQDDLDTAFLRRFDYGADIPDVASFFSTIEQVLASKQPAQADKPALTLTTPINEQSTVANVLLKAIARVGFKAFLNEMESSDAVRALVKSLRGSAFPENEAQASLSFQKDLYHQLVNLTLNTYGPESSEYQHALKSAVKHSGYLQERSQGTTDYKNFSEQLPKH
ncbi:MULTISPECIES: contact-dependent growth inhibition system immunity protein [unclassified Erwinia]|uniref:contact-dependent growth inhibition system immunity protein n=1 Tax=unclassified Erwinia TaxID=2622719 RepID=UPI00263B7753|nr:contact-dependent growth inhibition system immunity protein [Erwinia sp. PsM31]MDN4627562.1 contact-dependent growth inhibition system immunity protein [Erwinia sp. PsM31]